MNTAQTSRKHAVHRMFTSQILVFIWIEKADRFMQMCCNEVISVEDFKCEARKLLDSFNLLWVSDFYNELLKMAFNHSLHATFILLHIYILCRSVPSLQVPMSLTLCIKGCWLCVLMYVSCNLALVLQLTVYTPIPLLLGSSKTLLFLMRNE